MNPQEKRTPDRADGRHIDPQRLQQLLNELARFGRDPRGGISRIGFSEADRAAREWLMDLMARAGLEVWVDSAANIHGRRPGKEASLPAILFGSHIDTVPQGGHFDGALGSLGALEVLRTLQQEGRETRHPLQMVVWADEEGVHFGQGLFGSRAALLGPDPGEIELRDEEDVTLGEWLGRYGQQPERIDDDRLESRRFHAYLELHIEQGPFLHRAQTEVGVVQGIVGIHRFQVAIEGFANHAGTTLMEERQDALVAAARLTQAVREEVMAKPGRQVGNVGWIKTAPGAANVVPGHVEMPIELRDLKQGTLDDVLSRIRSRAAHIASEQSVRISIEPFAREDPALMDVAVQDLIEATARGLGFSTERMPSGAGHDAQIVARSGIPTGMIFVPSRNGVSHAPSEWTDAQDCARGVEILYRSVVELDGR